METDTKNKKGRPRTVAGEMARTFQQLVTTQNGLRGSMNVYYAYSLLNGLYGMPENGSFFISPQGKVRRQGILEQIGRMYEYELITKDQARELLEQCQRDYEAGQTVKEIEARLRELRKILQQ